MQKRSKEQIRKSLADKAIIGGTGAAALGAGTVALNVANNRGVLDKAVVRYNPSSGKPVYLIYTDKANGAGHYAQANAIRKEMEARNIPVKMMAIEEFMDPDAAKALNKPYKDWTNNPRNKKALMSFLKAYKAKWGTLDRRKLSRTLNNSGGVVVTNPWVQHAFTDVKMPINFLYSDPAIRVRHAVAHTGGVTVKDILKQYIPHRKAVSYYVTDTVREVAEKENTPKKNLRRIANVPVNMEAFQGKAKSLTKGKVGYMDPSNFNVILSGGGQGLDVDRAARDLLKAKTKSVNGKKVVFHVITGGSWGKSETGAARLARVEALAAKSGGSLIVHKERVPLPTMMRKADFLVIQPHGTSGTEAVLSKTPAMSFVQDPVKNGKAPQKKYYALLSNNAEYFSQKAGMPLASTGYEHLDVGAANKQSNVASVFDNAVANRGKIQAQMTSFAGTLENTPKKMVDDLHAYRKTVSRLQLKGPLSSRGGKITALAGTAMILGGLGAKHHKYIQKTLSRTGKVRYIYPKDK